MKVGEHMVIGIIGGGASGMAAALAASENPNVTVHIFERQARLGKKLSATGNGRCNLTNTQNRPYNGEDPAFAEFALEKFPSAETMAWFRSLGLYTVTEHSGKVYPYSDQANSVLDVLRLALIRPNVTIHTGCEIEKVTKDANGFCLQTAEESHYCQKLIVACGGIAGTKLGGTMSGYRLLGSLGHKSSRLRPALVQLTSNYPGLVSLKGVRANCNAKIYRNDTLFATGTGEIQFTETGISGPVIFEISRDVCEGRGEWKCVLDLLPDMSENDLLTMLRARRTSQLTTDDLLTGILHNRLGRVVTKDTGIGHCPIRCVSDDELKSLCGLTKHFAVSLTGTQGMDSAQVTAGGVYTKDFDPKTMESCLVPGLYACGEVLDIDGPCGGYNLQWAWSSGRLAGESAGKL